MRTADDTGTGVRGLWCLAALVLAAVSRGAEAFRLQLLHTNDMHSHFGQYNPAGLQCGDVDAECYGGFPRLKTAVRRAVDEAAEDGRDGGTLFLNAGDTFQGTLFFTLFKWRIVADLLPELEIDAMSLGNHEFDTDVYDLSLFLDHIDIPVVVCNIDVSNEPVLANLENKILKSKELNINGHRIGIIGYLTPDTAKLSIAGKVIFHDEVSSIQEEAKRLKDDGVNIIIALGHSGFEIDQKIAREVEEVDVVVGGHTNTFLYNGASPVGDKPVGGYPFCVTQPKTNRKVPVVQAFHVTKYLGQLWVEFDDNGEVLSSYGNPILMDSSIKQDSELLEAVKDYQKEFQDMSNKIIGQTAVYLNGYSDTCRFQECNLGNFFTDAYVGYNVRHNSKDFNSNEWTDAPIAVQHSGGIRADIDNSTNSGDITYYQLMRALPFMNTIGKTKMTGQEIHNMIENAFWKYDGQRSRGEFLQISGLKVAIDLSEPSGQRVMSIQVLSNLKGYENVYELLDLNKTYMVIMSEYTYEGGDGFKCNKTSSFKSLGATDFEIVEEQIKLKSPISPKVEKRIMLNNTTQAKANMRKRNSLKKLVQYNKKTCGSRNLY